MSCLSNDGLFHPCNCDTICFELAQFMLLLEGTQYDFYVCVDAKAATQLAAPLHRNSLNHRLQKRPANPCCRQETHGLRTSTKRPKAHTRIDLHRVAPRRELLPGFSQLMQLASQHWSMPINWGTRLYKSDTFRHQKALTSCGHFGVVSRKLLGIEHVTHSTVWPASLVVLLKGSWAMSDDYSSSHCG